MKLYQVKKGSPSILLANDGTGFRSIDWITRKNLTFSETVLDPIRLANLQCKGGVVSKDTPVTCVEGASKGYYTFVSDPYSEQPSKYLLMVHKAFVEVY